MTAALPQQPAPPPNPATRAMEVGCAIDYLDIHGAHRLAEAVRELLADDQDTHRREDIAHNTIVALSRDKAKHWRAEVINQDHLIAANDVIARLYAGILDGAGDGRLLALIDAHVTGKEKAA
jgi:hypothetical protein